MKRNVMRLDEEEPRSPSPTKSPKIGIRSEGEMVFFNPGKHIGALQCLLNLPDPETEDNIKKDLTQ